MDKPKQKYLITIDLSPHAFLEQKHESFVVEDVSSVREEILKQVAKERGKR